MFRKIKAPCPETEDCISIYIQWTRSRYKKVEQEFIARWKQLVWEYERKSIFALKHEAPQQWTQEEITSYLQKNKAHHRIYASWWMWLFVIWLPVLAITILGCALLGDALFQLAHNFGDILIFLYFGPVAIFVVGLVSIEYGVILSIASVYWTSWIFFWIVIIPFLPLLKLRQLQLRYAQSWKQSFLIAGWRKPQIENETTTQYTNTLDVHVRSWYKSLILAKKTTHRDLFFPDSYFLNPDPYESFLGYINPYKALWVLASLFLYISSILVLIFVAIFS